MRTACLHGMMTVISPNFHICAPYLLNNFYRTNPDRLERAGHGYLQLVHRLRAGPGDPRP
jgi:hypothetical protein